MAKSSFFLIIIVLANIIIKQELYIFAQEQQAILPEIGDDEEADKYKINSTKTDIKAVIEKNDTRKGYNRPYMSSIKDTIIDKPNVALIYPAFISAELTNEERNLANNTTNFKSGKLNIKLWTRAAVYELIDFDLHNNGKGGRLNRISSFVKPKNVYEETAFFLGEGTNKTIDTYMREKSPPRNNIALNIKPEWNRALAQTNFKISTMIFSLVMRDDTIQICRILEEVGKVDDSCNTFLFHLRFDLTTNWYQVSAIEAEHDQDETLTIYFFDVIGRLIVSNWRFAKTNGTVFELMIKHNENPMIFSLSSVVDDNNLMPFNAEGNIDSKGTQLFKRDFDKKLRTNFVETITPLLKNPTSLLKDDNNYRATNMKRIPLCVVNGYSITDTNDQKIPIKCKSNNVDLTKHLPQIISDNKVIIYAMEFYNYQNNSYFHFFFSTVKESSRDSNYYTFHKYPNTQISMDKEFDKSIEINITSGLKTEDVFSSPNDMVLYSQGACELVISFFDLQYSISSPDMPLSIKNFNTKANNNLTFYINAAMYYNNEFYFFTYDNKLIIMDGSFKNNICNYNSELVLSFKREETSQDFLMKHLYNIEQSTGPYLLGYREVTNYTYSPSDDMTKEDLLPSGNKASGSSIVVIVIGIIIGGLILAGLLYIFCLRGSDNDFGASPALARKSRRNKTPPEVDSGLHAVTVRSAVSTPSSMGNQGSGQKSPPHSPSRQQQQQQTQAKDQQKQQPQQQQQQQKQATKSLSPSSTGLKQTQSPNNNNSNNLVAHKSKSPGIKPVASRGSTKSTKSKSKSPATNSIGSSKSGQRSPAGGVSSKGSYKNIQHSPKSKSSNHSSKSKSPVSPSPKSPARKEAQTKIIDNKKDVSPSSAPAAAAAKK